MESLLLIVPIKNSSNLVIDFINRIKLQSFKNWNVILIDGNSEKKHINRIKDKIKNQKKFLLVKQDKKNLGIYGAMNMGIKLAKENQWLMFWGSDDRPSNHYVFENIMQFINQNLDLIKTRENNLVICKANYFDLEEKKFIRRSLFAMNNKKEILIKEKEFLKRLFLGECPPHQATLFKINKNDFLYSTRYFLAADLDLFLKLAFFKEIQIFTSKIDLVKIGHGGISSRKNRQRFYEVFSIYKKYFNYFLFIPFLLRYLRRLTA